MFTVYKATSPSNKTYVGITSKTLSRRRIQHLSSALAGSDYAFHRAIRKHATQIMWETLAEVETLEQAIELEKSFILAYNSFGLDGYNLTAGGEGQLGASFSHSQEAKEKISKNNSRFWLGKPRSEETKQKCSTTQKDKPRGPLSEATKLKLSEQKLGAKNPMFGKRTLKIYPQCVECSSELRSQIAKRCQSCAQARRHTLARTA